MMKPFTSPRNRSWKSLWVVLGLYAGLLIGLMAYSGASEASESHKKIYEGYYGPERFKALEKPVTPFSDVTVTKGWQGDKRIHLRTTPYKDVTITRGWVGNEYLRIREIRVPTTEEHHEPE